MFTSRDCCPFETCFQTTGESLSSGQNALVLNQLNLFAGGRERLTLCEVQVFAAELNFTPNPTQAEPGGNLSDHNLGTCLSNTHALPLVPLATVTVPEGDLWNFGDHVILTVLGSQSTCNTLDVAFVRQNGDHDCRRITRCKPDPTMSGVVVEGADVCSVLCPCPELPCTVGIMMLSEASVQTGSICEVIALKQKQI